MSTHWGGMDASVSLGVIYKPLEGWWDGSEDKGAYCQAWQPKLDFP